MKYFIWILDAIGVLLLLGLIILGWKLYSGPVSVPFLKPYVISALTPSEGDYRVSLDKVELSFGKPTKPIDVISHNLVFEKMDRSFVVEAKETSVSFSFKAFLSGVVAPKAVEIRNPHIVYNVISQEIDETQDEASQRKEEILSYVDDIGEAFEHLKDRGNTFSDSYINNVKIVDALIDINDIANEKSWQLKDVDFEIDRGFADINTKLSLILNYLDKELYLSTDMNLDITKSELGLSFYFDNLVPSYMSEQIGAYKEYLGGINIPLSGSLITEFDLETLFKAKADNYKKIVDESIYKLNFELFASQGVASLPNFIGDTKYEISNIKIKGGAIDTIDNIKIDEAKIVFADGVTSESVVQIKGLKDIITANEHH